MRRFAVPALALLALAGWAPATGGPRPNPEAQDAFSALTDEYLSFHAYFNPVEATTLGIHDYDGRLPDLSQDGLFSLVAAYHQWLERLENVDRERLGGDAYWDHRILEYGIRDRLLDLEEIRWWERDPLAYVTVITEGLAAVAQGEYTSPSERMRAVTARERQVPELLKQARTNLLDPSRTLTELALESAAGAVRLAQDDLPRAFEGVPEGPTRDSFERINRQTIEELRRFRAWLEDLLPRAVGDGGLGPDLLERKLRFHEHLDISLEELDGLVGEEIDRYRRWVESEARAAEAVGTSWGVMEAASQSPRSDSILARVEADVREARAFVAEEDLLTLPEGPLPRIQAMPPRGLETVASLTPSGPFEPGPAVSARYVLRLPREGWTESRPQTHRKLSSPAALLARTAGDTYPGRWVAALFAREIASGIRKVFRPVGLTGGWSDYAQEMAVDRGLGGGDPAVRVAQLQQALIELARLKAALRMHAGEASLEEGARIFQDVAGLEAAQARGEALRAAADPLDGAGWIGKMQISRLRADYQERLTKEGDIYVLGNFHDRFLRLGVPIPLARRILLPGDERPSLATDQ